MNTPPEYVTVESALKTTVELYGLRRLGEPGFLRPLLERLCPDALHDVTSVLTALDAHVPQTLVGAPDDEARLEAAGALEKKLRGEYRMNRYAAAWTVRTWLDALGLTMAATTPMSPALVAPDVAAPPAPAPAPVPVARPAAVSPRVEPSIAVTPKEAPPSPQPAAPPTPTPTASRPPPRPASYRWLRPGLAVACLVAAVVAFRTPDRPPQVDARRTPVTSTPADRVQAAPCIAEAAPAPVAAPAPAPTPTEASPALPTPSPSPPPVVDVVPATPAPPSPAVQARELPSPRRAAALASSDASPARAAPACRPGTCGTVVVVQEVASAPSELTARVEDALGVKVDRPAASAKVRYDVVVRFDDHDVRTLRSDRRFGIGERVRAVGNDDRLTRIAGG